MNCTQIVGSENFADVALDIWSPSQQVSDTLCDLMPQSSDLLAEIRRHVPAGTELMPRVSKRRHLVLTADPERIYPREKFYVRAFLEHEYVIGRSADHVRRACFDAARLVGEHLAKRIADVRTAHMPPPGASVDYNSARYTLPAPLTVRFTAEPMNLLARDYDNAFACLDPVSDRVAIHFASYFVICPPGEEWQPTEENP